MQTTLDMMLILNIIIINKVQNKDNTKVKMTKKWKIVKLNPNKEEEMIKEVIKEGIKICKTGEEDKEEAIKDMERINNMITTNTSIIETNWS